MGLEERFHQAVENWIVHCRNNSVSSSVERYLDCDAYREIVAMGSAVLPLIRDQLQTEYEIGTRYESELERIKLKVFGTKEVDLTSQYDGGENYRKIEQDEEYRQYRAGFEQEVSGHPEILWRFVIREIIPEVDLPGEGWNYRTLKATIEWLDQNMEMYRSHTGTSH